MGKTPKDMLGKLRKEMEGLSEGQVILIISKAEDNMKINTQILNNLIKKAFGLYITVNRPYSSLREILKRNGVDIDRIFFIDCITTTVKGSPKEDERCIYIDSPNSLTDISISITEALEAIKGKKFLFMDTLSTLLIYNSSGSLAKFSHFLISKIKLLKLTGIFISVEDEMDKSLLKQISQFCDKTIRI